MTVDDTVSIDDLDFGVALVTPGGVPGVTEDPVVNITLGAIADKLDGVVVVGVGWAVSIHDDFATCVSESIAAGVDGDGDW